MLPKTSLEERLKRTRADINVSLPGSDAGIRRTAEHATAKALAASTHGLQGLYEWLALQVVPGPDSSPETLERWLSRYGSPRKQPAVASGTIRITGTATTAVVAGTEFQLADGTIFETDANVTITDEGGGMIYADAAITAQVTGTVGNADVDTVLRLVSPVSGVDSEAIVQDDGSGEGLSGGTDLETAAQMWTRLQSIMQDPPAAGTEADYRNWALEVSGVTRAWAEGGALGAGSVRVMFVRDGDLSIIPSAGEVSTVQDYIDALKPVTANVVVAAPTAATLDFTISGVTDATSRSNIEAQLEDHILRKAEPAVTLEIEAIIGAIALASGSAGFGLTSPAADVTHDELEIPVMGTITWT